MATSDDLKVSVDEAVAKLQGMPAAVIPGADHDLQRRLQHAIKHQHEMKADRDAALEGHATMVVALTEANLALKANEEAMGRMKGELDQAMVRLAEAEEAAAEAAREEAAEAERVAETERAAAAERVANDERVAETERQAEAERAAQVEADAASAKAEEEAADADRKAEEVDRAYKEDHEARRSGLGNHPHAPESFE